MANDVEVWALQVGTRASWMEQLGGHWETDEEHSRDLDGGPDIDLSGASFRFVLGIGQYQGRRRGF